MNVSQNPESNSPRIMKKRLSQEQVQLLEASFDATSKLDPERKFQLARELGVPPRQVAIWYQNKRARWRNQSLERDHGSLQVQLEAALADKERLEREVEDLRGELKRAQDMLFGFGRAEAQEQQLARAEPGQQSSCGDEGAGSSSLNHDDLDGSGDWVNGEGLQLEELYACLMVGTVEW